MLGTTTRRGLAVAAVAVTVALAAAVLAPHGSAGSAKTAVHFRLAALSCGDTVTVSTKLTSDVTGCGSGVAVTLAGTHVVLDLNGHEVGGTGSGTGVDVAGAGDVLQNGLVDGFQNGVFVASGVNVGSRVQAVRSTGNSEYGLQINGQSTVVTGSFFASNGSDGIVVLGDHAQITNNWIRSNHRGIAVIDPAAGTTISGNRILSNAVEGILVDTDGAGTAASSNVVNANGGDGIAISGAGTTTLAKNVANFNTGLGIGGEFQSVDGGGNTARGNGKLHQCENVVCS